MSHTPARAVSILVCAMSLFVIASAHADDPQPPKPSDAAAGMLDAMREKGIINDEEYADLYKRQAIYEMEQQQKSALPGWLTGWTFGGDATVRWDEIDRGGQLKIGKVLNAQHDPVDLVNGVAGAKQERFRLRLRLGAEHTLGEDFLVGFRLATGQASNWATDPFLNGFDLSRHFAFDSRSAFVTMGDYFAPKSIGLDRLYITWAPHLLPGFSASVGKMQNPFVSEHFSGDILVFDHDISPEGVQLGYTARFFGEQGWIKLNAGYYRVDNVVQATVPLHGNIGVPATTDFPDIDEKDPFMYSWQMEGGGDITPFLQVGGRVSYYDLRDINARTAAAMEFLGNGGDAIDHNPLFAPAFAPGFGFPTDGASRGHARELVFDAYTKIVPAEGWSIVPWFQLTHMLDASSENYGYDTGFDLFLPTNTQLTFMYGSMPRNGTISIFTDFDFFEGYVNARGWGLTVIQNLNRWVTLSGQFYTSEQRNIACGIPSVGDIHASAVLCDESVWNNPVLALYRRQILDRQHFFIDLSVKF
jgi:putative porin